MKQNVICLAKYVISALNISILWGFSMVWFLVLSQPVNQSASSCEGPPPGGPHTRSP